MARRKLEVLGKTTLSDEIDQRVAEAEDAVAAEEEVRTSLRWRREQMRAVQRAAALFGIPYQTYLKQAAFRQAIADIQAATAAGVAVPSEPAA